MSEAVVLTDIDAKGIATITLNRPEVFNAYNPALLTALTETVGRLAADDAVRVVLVRGAGKHFSAGADVNWFKELAEATPEQRKTAADLSTGAMRGLYEMPKPTIALVHNACFGGGVGYAAACDVVIASEDARFAVTEVRIGITPAPILRQLITAIGLRHTRRYAVTAETFDVYRAQHIGLVSEVCPVGGLDDAAKPVIDALLLSAPIAVRDTKRLIAEVSESDIADDLADRLAAKSAAGRGTPEGIEGFQAFLGKRKPNWYPGD